MIFDSKDLVKVLEIDCTETLPPEKYYESAPTEIVEAAFGNYRQGNPAHYSRFAWRFRLDEIQRPYLVDVCYPDDRARNMCVMDGHTYDLTTGIGTGYDIPVSNSMRRHRILYWPRSTDGSILFLNYANPMDPEMAPAAVSKIMVWKYNGPALDTAKVNLPADRRKIGMQWEDPCGKLKTLGADSIETWSRRLAAYAALCGQNMVEYPISWYWGPMYPSEVEKTDIPCLAVKPDWSIYFLDTPNPSDWVSTLIRNLRERGISFRPVVHLIRLKSLVELGKEQIAAGLDSLGEKSVFNVRDDGQYQTEINDWTRVFTAESMKDGWDNPPEMIGHEHFGGGIADLHIGVMYNVLHPVVQNRIARFFKEIGRRYGESIKCGGATVPLWLSTMLWFGSDHVGYDDCSIAMFERDTGIFIPSAPSGKNRFVHRAAWIKANAGEKFLDWRCRKIREFLTRLAHELGGPLTLSICIEPLLGQLYRGRPTTAARFQLSDPGNSLAEICRRGGLDLSLYADKNDPVTLEIQSDPYRSRHQHDQSFPLVYREYSWLDDKTLELCRGKNISHFIFNCYYEGGYYRIVPEKDNAGFTDAGMGKVEKVCRFILQSQEKKIWDWYPDEFTTCSGVPFAGIHFMEPYAHALAAYDARTITEGGLTPGLYGHEEELKLFSERFTLLPDAAFETVGNSTDPVAVRFGTDHGRTIFYAVNQSGGDVPVRIRFPENSVRVTELPSGRIFPIRDGVLELELAPYGLRVFETNVIPDALTAEPSVEAAKKLESERAALREDIRRYLFGGPGEINPVLREHARYFEWLDGKLESAIRNGMTARGNSILFSMRNLHRIYYRNLDVRKAMQNRFEASLRMHGRVGILCGSTREKMDKDGNVLLPDQTMFPGVYGQLGASFFQRDPDQFPDAHCQAEANGQDMLYSIPLPEGRWNVTLYFAETYFQKRGERIFTVRINSGEPVIVDPFRDAGGFAKPYRLTENITIRGNQPLTVALKSSGNTAAVINGIEIRQEQK